MGHGLYGQHPTEKPTPYRKARRVGWQLKGHRRLFCDCLDTATSDTTGFTLDAQLLPTLFQSGYIEKLVSENPREKINLDTLPEITLTVSPHPMGPQPNNSLFQEKQQLFPAFPPLFSCPQMDAALPNSHWVWCSLH